MAKRQACPACGSPFQVGRLVWFNARTGVRRTRVCAKCARAGITVVNDRSHKAELCVGCDKRAAVFCSICARPRLGGA
jgi:hypothetical protein